MQNGLNALHLASKEGHVEVVAELIKHGANVNAMDLWQFTPLHEAASKSRIEVMLHLILEQSLNRFVLMENVKLLL